MNTKNKLAEHKKDVASLFFVLNECAKRKDCKRLFSTKSTANKQLHQKSHKKGTFSGRKASPHRSKRPATKSK